MPELSRFYGITIQMYYKGSDHNPPHLHARYGSNVAEIAITSGNILQGYLPVKAQIMVKEWVLIHKEELIDIWNTQVFKKIEPLE